MPSLHDSHDHEPAFARTSFAAAYLSERSRLVACGLRPTRQRVVLAKLLFGSDHQHFTAETLHREACANHTSVSLATVYNILRDFSDAQLIRRVLIAGSAHYDTNIGDHRHFYIEDEDLIIDIHNDAVRVEAYPEPPSGYVIIGVDVLIRLISCSATAPITKAIETLPRKGSI
jgi:Fur family iron response transcriptional regulator